MRVPYRAVRAPCVERRPESESAFFGLGREKPILALLLTAGRGRDHRHHGLNDYIPPHDLAALDVVSGGRSEELLLHVTMFVIS